jgi:hypothetical protein
MIALTSGMLGIMVASYGNAVLGQVPTSMLIYTSMALMLNAETIDKEAIACNLEAQLPVSVYKKRNLGAKTEQTL